MLSAADLAVSSPLPLRLSGGWPDSGLRPKKVIARGTDLCVTMLMARHAEVSPPYRHRCEIVPAPRRFEWSMFTQFGSAETRRLRGIQPTFPSHIASGSRTARIADQRDHRRRDSGCACGQSSSSNSGEFSGGVERARNTKLHPATRPVADGDLLPTQRQPNRPPPTTLNRRHP